MSDNIIIRRVQPSDAQAFYDLRLTALKTNPEGFGSDWQSMETDWTPQTYAARIPDDNSDDCVIVAEIDGRLVGMIGFVRGKRRKTKHAGDIWGVFLHPDARGQGIGTQMMTALMQHIRNVDGLRQVNLSVITANTAAIALYESAGFVTWGTQPDGLFVDGVYHDMYYMRCALD